MDKRSQIIQFKVSPGEDDLRLDRLLKNRYPEWGRQRIGRLIGNKGVSVNDKVVWLSSWKVKSGDLVVIEHPPLAKPAAPQRFEDAWIVSEEDDLIVVDKPAGLRSQATRAGGSDNLLSLAEARFGAVHLFHRLDRDTSGLCVLTRPGPVNAYLDAAFKEQRVEKEYLAVVSSMGRLTQEGIIDAALGPHPRRKDMMQAFPPGAHGRGVKTAETRYWVVGECGDGFLLRLQPLTGRTHQLRVHLAYLGAPIMGDRLYGGARAKRLMLHAARLILPADGEYPQRIYTVAADGFSRTKN